MEDEYAYPTTHEWSLGPARPLLDEAVAWLARPLPLRGMELPGRTPFQTVGAGREVGMAFAAQTRVAAHGA